MSPVFLNQIKLFGRKLSAFSLRKIFGKRKSAHRKSMKLRNLCAEAAEHSFYLMISSFKKRNNTAVFILYFQSGGLAYSVGKGNSFFKSLLHFFGHRNINGNGVALFYMLFRRKDSVGKIAVVGYYHKAGGVFVKPSCGKKPFAKKLRRNKLQHGLLRGILRGGNIALWFIQYNIYVLIFAYFVAVKNNFIRFGSFIFGNFYDGAVYKNFSVGYGGFYLFSGKSGSVGYVFIKAFRGEALLSKKTIFYGIDLYRKKA